MIEPDQATPTADAIWGAFCRQQIAPTRLRISHATLRALRKEVGGSSYFGDQAALLDDPVNPRFMSMAVDEVPAAGADAPGWQVMRAEESDAFQARK